MKIKKQYRERTNVFFLFVLALLLQVNLYATVKKTSEVVPIKNYVSYSFNGNILTIQTDKGLIQILPYTDKIVKVIYSDKETNYADKSHCVILPPQNVNVNFQEKEGFFSLSTDYLTVKINKKPLQITYSHKDKLFLSEENGFTKKEKSKGFRFKLHKGERIYGGGARAISLDRRGYELKLYNEPHYGYGYGEVNLNYSIPLIFSSRKYAILFDNPQKGKIDIGKSEADILEFSSIGGDMAYYLLAGESFYELMESYTKLTGTQPLPPRWAMGNFLSRFGYRSEKETREIVDLMIKENFPIDAVIIDLFWFGKGTHGKFNMGDLDWDKDAWSNPEKMIQDFKAKGIRTILITEPFVLKESKNFAYTSQNKLLATDKNGESYIMQKFYFGKGGILDIFKPETREWFWGKYKKQIDIGVDAWWGDLGEPEHHPSDVFHLIGKADEVHNIYGHYWDKMLFEKYAEAYPNVRLFNLNRSGFAGSQRYGVFPWSGDVGCNWSGLKAQFPVMLGMSMCGLAYMHSDLGGFSAAKKQPELYKRWMQFGTFTPIYRPHGDASSHPSEPVFYKKSIKDIVRKYMQLRYKMLPYNYTLAWENSVKGTPLTIPLFFEEPENAEVQTIEDEYLWGRNILVAPIYKKKQKVRKIYFPKGKWIDFWNDNAFDGNKWSDYKINKSDIPVFVRAGSFIPMIPKINTTKDYTSEVLHVHFYFDKSVKQSIYRMYEDDGITKDAYKNGFFQLLNFRANVSEKEIAISLSKTGKPYKGMPEKHSMNFKIHRINAMPKEVWLGTKKLPVVSAQEKWENTTEGIRWNATQKMLDIKFDYLEGSKKLKIRL